MNNKANPAVSGQVSPSGRISLPAEFRKAMGLQKGGKVVVELAGDEIRIRTAHAAVVRAQAVARRIFGDTPSVSSDDFLAHRREDWNEG